MLDTSATMSRNANCRDNAVAGSFFAMREWELLADRDFATCAMASRHVGAVTVTMASHDASENKDTNRAHRRAELLQSGNSLLCI